jgi:hypothetical protein
MCLVRYPCQGRTDRTIGRSCAPFTTTIDRREIGRKVADYGQDPMRRMVELADEPVGGRFGVTARAQDLARPKVGPRIGDQRVEK